MTTNTRSLLWIVTGLILLLFPISESVAAEACKGVSIHAPAAFENENQNVCKAAQQARKFLSQCGIEQKKDINITIVEKLIHPSDLPVFAFFHSPKNQVMITDFYSFKKLITPDTAYDQLPSHELYESLVAHEVAHAISFQNSLEINRTRPALEYIASVVQVSAMSMESRQILLNAFPQSGPANQDMFNVFSLYAAPHWFVANAYRHYSGLDNGCVFLRDILKGKIQFLGFPE